MATYFLNIGKNVTNITLMLPKGCHHIIGERGGWSDQTVQMSEPGYLNFEQTFDLKLSAPSKT